MIDAARLVMKRDFFLKPESAREILAGIERPDAKNRMLLSPLPAVLNRLRGQTTPEDLPQVLRNLVTAMMRDAVREDPRKFALVEPQPVPARAKIIRHGMISTRNRLRHFLPADWTLPRLIGRASVRCSSVQKCVALARVAEKKRQFARIQPNAIARETIIDLKPLIFEDSQRLFAYRTIHGGPAFQDNPLSLPDILGRRVSGIKAGEVPLD